MTNLIIFAENCIADAQMLIAKALVILVLVGIVYAAVVGINIAYADDDTQNYRTNPSNAHDIIYGKSIIADNFYHHNGNYDIQYDGNTCMRWLTDSYPVVIANPSIVTYSDPIDDFDLLNIIACEA